MNKINFEVVKRNGMVESFDILKIKNALFKISKDTKKEFVEKDWEILQPRILSRIEDFRGKDLIHISSVDDMVMEALIQADFKDVAIEYIKARKTTVYDNVNDLSLTPVSMSLLKERYLEKDSKGEIVETPKEMMSRIATAVASAELTSELRSKYKEEFFRMLCNLEFLPNSPCLISAGSKRKGTSAACFAYAIPDSLSGMFDTYKLVAMTLKMGGGVGTSISNVRERGAYIYSTKGWASGPVSLVMPVLDSIAEGIKQGSFRRSALMVLMDIWHPDIEEFIDIKSDTTKLTNMNTSVMLDKKFMDAVKKNQGYDLISTHTKEVKRTVPAEYLLDRIANRMWETGEPGVLFSDNINKANPTPHLGPLTLVNPCITGDTLIAVADGRNAISIKQLVEEEKDIPVYCQNMISAAKGKLNVEIKWGRHPRKTGINQDVYRVLLDDGSSIKATHNHKFMRRDGTWVELRDLKEGDSLMPFNTIKDDPYITVYTRENFLERNFRLCWEFINGKQPKGMHLHHSDFDPTNDILSNIQLVDAYTHLKIIHKPRDISGDKNPVHVLKKNLKKYWLWRERLVLAFTGDKNPMFGKKRHHSEETRLKTRKTLLENSRILKNLGLKVYDFEEKQRQGVKDTRTKESINKAQEEGLNYVVTGNIVRVIKNCLYCGNKLLLPFMQRHRKYCGMSCFNKYTKTGIACPDHVKKILSKSLKDIVPWNKGLNKQQQLNYRNTYYNHKVIGIEYCGKEDVYNITVDDNHNYFVVSKHNLDKTSTGVCLANCAESVLYDKEQCDLGSINLVRHLKDDNTLDWDKLAKTVKLSVRFLDNIIDKSNYPDPEVKKKVLLTRKIGVGIMGFADMLILMNIRYSDKAALHIGSKIISFMRDIAEQESKRIGKEKGLYEAFKEGCPRRRNSIVLTLAPTGSISMIAGVSSGIEPNFAKSYSRTIYPENKIITFEHPLKDYPAFESTYDVPVEQHVKMLSVFQEYVDNSVSKTINCPERTSIEDIKKIIIQAHGLGVKGLTIFRQNCHRKSLIKCEGDTCSL